MTSKEGDETYFPDSGDQRREFLRRQRGGKKGSITKRILQIDDIIKENGSRTRISSLFESLLLVQKEATDINQALEDMGDDTEDYLEDIKYQIDNIRSKIDEYLELRREDAPSEAGGSPWLLNRFCLLYTSPSPRDGLLSRMPSSA